MEKKSSNRNVRNVFGTISLGVALIILCLILNWFFKITPYQKLEGLPILIAPAISGIGLFLGCISIKVEPNDLGKWGIISNTIILILSSLYWFLGTLIFGP